MGETPPIDVAGEYSTRAPPADVASAVASAGHATASDEYIAAIENGDPPPDTSTVAVT